MKHEPKHGVRTVHKDGHITHIALCACHPAEMARLTDKTNVLPEIQSLMDILHRRIGDSDDRIKDLEDLIVKTEQELKAMLAKMNSGYAEALKAVVTELHGHHVEHLSRIELLDKRMADTEASLKKVSLWNLVKRCFTR